MSLLPRALVSSILSLIGVLAIASPALAHIDPDPAEAPAGSEQSVGFTVQHGCSGSPTLELRMRLPDGVTNVALEPPPGWDGSVEGNVVTFTGGPLVDDVDETFRVRLTLPLTPDTTIYFPFVQRCEQGEIAWIDVPQDGSGTELDEPAPAMTLTAALPGTTAAPTSTSAPSATTTAAIGTNTTTQPAATNPSTPQTTTVTSPQTTFVIGTAAEPVASTPTSVAGADESEDDAKGSAGSIAFYATVLVVVAGGATVLYRARRSR